MKVDVLIIVCLGKPSDPTFQEWISLLVSCHKSVYRRLWVWCCVTFCTGHSKLYNYPSSFLPQAPEEVSKQMSLEADPEPEKVRLCVSQKLLGFILASLHVFAFPVPLAVIFVHTVLGR